MRWPAARGAYGAEALTGRLAPGALSRLLLARRRALGVAFATAHALHLVALGAALRAAGQAPDAATAGVGGAAFAAIFAMAATSAAAAVRRLGRHWRTLHGAGLHLVWFVFAFTCVTRLARGSSPDLAGNGRGGLGL